MMIEVGMHLCPHCGCDLAPYAPVEFGNVQINEEGRVVFNGAVVGLTRCQHDIASALVRARGRQVTRGVLANLVAGDVNDATIVKYVERTRASFRMIDPQFDQIESVQGFGAYRWTRRCRA